MKRAATRGEESLRVCGISHDRFYRRPTRYKSPTGRMLVGANAQSPGHQAQRLHCLDGPCFHWRNSGEPFIHGLVAMLAKHGLQNEMLRYPRGVERLVQKPRGSFRAHEARLFVMKRLKTLLSINTVLSKFTQGWPCGFLGHSLIYFLISKPSLLPLLMLPNRHSRIR